MSNKIRDQEESNRQTIYLNDRAQNQQIHLKFFNDIKTSKYNWWNFLPKSLILQFMRAANLYFLVATVIQCIDFISPLAPFSAVGPLILVLAVSLSREAIEDYKRHRNDDLVNEQKSFIFNNKNFTSIMWKDIQIGDIIKVNCEQILPADILVITTNEENGIGYIETANLDGERNLKSKSSNEVVNKYGREEPLINFKGKIVCDKPNNRIHSFKGLLYLDKEKNPIVLNNNNIMLRGTTVKNTEWVIGIVIYSGQETKIMKNQGEVKHKSTHIEKALNPLIGITLFIQSVMCLTMAILFAQFQKKTYPKESDEGWNYVYLYGNSDEGMYSYQVQGTINYFTYFLLLNTLIPISLIISMEVVKLLQSSFMEYDIEMQNIVDGQVQKMKVLNTLIHEELGKIEYIFTDKTGTLTSNMMIFRHANVVGQDFSEKELEEILCKIEYQTLTSDEEYKDFYNFWLCVALCHDVILEEKDNKICYQGSSPDEVCLVEMAQKYNFKFCKKTTNQVFVQVGTEMLTFKLLNKIEFNSDRKRMSVIVQDPQTNKIIVFTKGADSFLMKNLSNTTEALKKNIKSSLKHYSKQGLRTLCLGMKEISIQDYDKWNKKYNDLQMSMVGDLNPEKTKELLNNIENELETQFDILGVTALEDKLQDGVPEVLKDIHEAGINVWMLTGDKLETAENIGYLCNLLNNQTKIFRVQSHYIDVTRDKFFRIKGKINQIKTVSEIGEIKIKNNLAQQQQQQSQSDSRLSKKKINHLNRIINDGISRKDSYITKEEYNNSLDLNQVKGYTGFALIIEGEAIGHALLDEQCKKEFLAIIPECSTVICCRSTPKQKAEMVKFVKTHFNKICLAIGDGGNDVSMIQEADIGVGIIGKEGNQAALSSDYYFGQFRFLGRLLFVHGRWNLFRTSYFVNYFFLKNFIFTIQQFIFGFYCASSGQSFWEDGYLLNFNSIITACAPVYFAAFEQDVNPDQSEYIQKYLPRLYKQFRSMELFSYKIFGKIFLQGCFHGLVIYYSVYFIIVENEGVISTDGKIDGLWYQSVLAYFCTVGVVWAINFMDTKYFSPFTFFSYVIVSLVLFFPSFVFVWDLFDGPLQNMLVVFISNWKFWLTLFLNVAIVFVIKYTEKVYNYLINPQLIHDLQYHRKTLKDSKNRVTTTISSNIECDNNKQKATTPHPQQQTIVIQDDMDKGDNQIKISQDIKNKMMSESRIDHLKVLSNSPQNKNISDLPITEAKNVELVIFNKNNLLKLNSNNNSNNLEGRINNQNGSKPQSCTLFTNTNIDQSVVHSEQSNFIGNQMRGVTKNSINITHQNNINNNNNNNNNNNSNHISNTTPQKNGMHDINNNNNSSNILILKTSNGQGQQLQISPNHENQQIQNTTHQLLNYQKNKKLYSEKNQINGDDAVQHVNNNIFINENNENEEEERALTHSHLGSNGKKRGSPHSNKRNSIIKVDEEDEDFNDDEMNEYDDKLKKINKIPKEQNKKISVYEKESQLQSKIYTKGNNNMDDYDKNNLQDSKKIYHLNNEQFDSMNGSTGAIPKQHFMNNGDIETSQQLKDYTPNYNNNNQTNKMNPFHSEKNSEIAPASRYEGVKIPQADSDNSIVYQSEAMEIPKQDEPQKQTSKSKFSQQINQQDNDQSQYND